MNFVEETSIKKKHKTTADFVDLVDVPTFSL